MKFLINTASTFKGGGVQVAISILEELQQMGLKEVHVIAGKRFSQLVNEEMFPDYKFHPVSERPAERLLSLKSPSVKLRAVEEQVKPDVVFTTSGPAYWRPNAPHLVGYNLPHYIYPESPFFSTLPPLKRIKWRAKGALLKRFFLRDSDAFVVQTDDVNQRFRNWTGRTAVHTVTNNCSRHYLSPSDEEPLLPAREEGEFRLLTLSAWYAHKNLEIIPPILKLLGEDELKRVRFVLTLPDEDYRRVIPSQFRKYVYNTGPVPPKAGPSLYRECDALFLPTLLECFSASYPEAMAMERPILTSDLSFARDICGDAAIYAEPLNEESWANSIRELLHNPEKRKELVAHGKRQLGNFDTPADRAKKIWTICKQLADERES